MEGKTFLPRRNFKNLLFVALFTMPFFGVGVLILAKIIPPSILPQVPGPEGLENHLRVAVYLLFLTTVAEMFLIGKALTPTLKYTISPNGIELWSGVFPESIGYEQIKELKIVSNEEAGDLVIRARSSHRGDFEKYCTVSPQASNTAFPVKKEMRLEESYLVLSLKNGNNLLLSPQQVDAFFKEFSKFLPQENTLLSLDD